MESELIPGINFEYTLDDVLFEKYDKFLCEKYFIDTYYLDDHAEELIQLRDVVIPYIPKRKLKKLYSDRVFDDSNVEKGSKLGIYYWKDVFDRGYYRNLDELREDNIRVALDIVRKYPEHKDLVKLREDYEIKEDVEE